MSHQSQKVEAEFDSHVHQLLCAIQWFILMPFNPAARTPVSKLQTIWDISEVSK